MVVYRVWEGVGGKKEELAVGSWFAVVSEYGPPQGRQTASREDGQMKSVQGGLQDTCAVGS